MELHEFQAKSLLSRYAIASPKGQVALTPDEAELAARDCGSRALFVKAQVQAGDRAQAGGVIRAASAAETRLAAAQLLGRKLVTAQTGRRGHTIKRVLVETGVAAVREFYVAMRIDALAGGLELLAGTGGTGIEARAAALPSAIESVPFGLAGERHPGDTMKLCERIGLAGDTADKFRAVVDSIHRAFVDNDASLIEINPLALTGDGEFVALDAKLVLDDNALFRHPDLAALRDDDVVDEIELEAQRHQINFVQMDGDIGVVVNGAGLGLATLDMLRAAGGSPANFMDIRTTAKSLDIAHGIGLVLDKPHIKVLLVNVFGGGMQPCDTIIEGLGIAFRRKGRVLPVVLRVTGNNEQLARLRLANFNFPKIECSDMWQAVERAVAIARGRT